MVVVLVVGGGVGRSSPPAPCCVNPRGRIFGGSGWVAPTQGEDIKNYEVEVIKLMYVGGVG